MAKSKYTEKCTVSAEGVFNLEDMTGEIEDIGTKKLSEVLAKFDGCVFKIVATLGNDLD